MLSVAGCAAACAGVEQVSALCGNQHELLDYTGFWRSNARFLVCEVCLICSLSFL